jgi:acyl-CoA reductase-like NAD-dependent aldehyde dehydrogenase
MVAPSSAGGEPAPASPTEATAEASVSLPVPAPPAADAPGAAAPPELAVPRHAPSIASEVDRAVEELGAAAQTFARMPPKEKADLLERCLPLLLASAREQVAVACAAKGIDPASPASGEEWIAGPYPTVANARQLVDGLREIADFGRPLLPQGAIVARDDGRVFARVIPQRGVEGLLMRGSSADVYMKEGVSRDDVTAHQAAFYRQSEPEGGVSLVLGAGNVASIGPMDALYKLFVEGRVVLLKMSPVNDYLGDFILRGFAPLVEKGLLRVVYGGPEEGAYMVHHPGIADVHVTGSNETHDAIVWGPRGAEREARRAEGRPLFTKPITSELGNVSPVVVIPFLYDKDELWFQARSVASQVVNNASFNCNAAKMLVLPRGWAQRDLFLGMIEKALSAVAPRPAYYPGAAERWARLTAGREDVLRIGDIGDPRADRPAPLPWTVIRDVDARAADEPLLRTEPFCSILSVVTIASDDPLEMLQEATRFCNERLWGTLNAMLIVHPLLLEDEALAGALDRALLDLRYGTVAVNHWPAVGYAAGVTPWGGHPSATLADAQSGLGFVHNSAMLADIEKVVLRGPVRAFPRPPYFCDRRNTPVLGERLTELAAEPTWQRAWSVAATAIRG